MMIFRSPAYIILLHAYINLYLNRLNSSPITAAGLRSQLPVVIISRRIPVSYMWTVKVITPFLADAPILPLNCSVMFCAIERPIP